MQNRSTHLSPPPPPRTAGNERADSTSIGNDANVNDSKVKGTNSGGGGGGGDGRGSNNKDGTSSGPNNPKRDTRTTFSAEALAIKTMPGTSQAPPSVVSIGPRGSSSDSGSGGGGKRSGLRRKQQPGDLQRRGSGSGSGSGTRVEDTPKRQGESLSIRSWFLFWF